MKMRKTRIELLQEILPYVGKYKAQWILLLCLKIGQRLPLLLQPLVFRAFILYVIDAKKMSYMVIIVALSLGLYLIDTILKVWHRIIDNSLFNQITADFRKILFQHYMNMPIDKYNTYPVNDLVRRLHSDVDMVKFFLVGQVFDYISYIVSIFIATFFLFSLEWRLAVTAYIVIPFSIKLSRKYEDALSKNAEQDRNLITKIEECVEKISSFWKEMKANQFEPYQEKDFSHVLDAFLHCKYENSELTFRRKLALNSKETIVDLLGMYVISGIFSLFYPIAAGTAIAYIGYYHNILEYFQEIMEINTALSWMKPSISRVTEILNLPVGAYHHDHQNNFDGRIYDVKNLCFTYNNSNRAVIQNLSFFIQKGDKVLLEGASGSGKSTLIQLLTGELNPMQGKVLLKGKDLSQFSEIELYKHIRIINQNTYYMNISVREFLTMARPNTSDDEMIQVCKAVNLWNDLESGTDGLEVFIGENGSNLSKGQKQKLALARLLLNKNKIIILDEAFSAIDTCDKTAIIDILLRHFKEERFYALPMMWKLKGILAEQLGQVEQIPYHADSSFSNSFSKIKILTKDNKCVILYQERNHKKCLNLYSIKIKMVIRLS